MDPPSYKAGLPFPSNIYKNQIHPQRLTVCPALECHDACKTILSFWDGTVLVQQKTRCLNFKGVIKVSHAKKKKTALLSMKYWFFKRGPYNGLL